MLRELRAADRIGIPLSVARGRRRPGSYWTRQDWLLAQAYVEHVESLCPGCGQPRHLSMDPATESQWKADDPVRCHSCTAVDVAKRAFEKANEQVNYAPPAGLFWSSRLPEPTAGQRPRAE